MLVANMGTPDAPTTSATRRYIAEFLTDPRVIDLPRWWWRILLHGRVLRTRPRQSARLYASIWQPEGSPILVHSQAIVDALSVRWAERTSGRVAVTLGMRYGNPSIAEALHSLRDEGVDRLVVLPLYPQYSGVTVGSTFDAVAETVSSWRHVPAMRFISRYHDDADYISALVASIEAVWVERGPPDHLLFSLHGLPKRYCDLGDPYADECHETARLVSEVLRLEDDRWSVAFQSQFGREEWLRPYTEDRLAELGRERLGRVDVICPGFAADCLETLEEIAIRGRESFEEVGGGTLNYIPALNDDANHVAALAGLVERTASDWL